MDSTTENLSPKQIAGKIAELNQSHNELLHSMKGRKSLAPSVKIIHHIFDKAILELRSMDTTTMEHIKSSPKWAEKITELTNVMTALKFFEYLAEVNILAVRLRNIITMKLIKSLEKLLSETTCNQAKTSRLCRGKDHDANTSKAHKIKKMEKEVFLLMAEYQKVTAEPTIWDEEEANEVEISKMMTKLKTFKCYLENQFEQQGTNEILDQMPLNDFEEAIGEYTNIIQKFALKNQELKREFEEISGTDSGPMPQPSSTRPEPQPSSTRPEPQPSSTRPRDKRSTTSHDRVTEQHLEEEVLERTHLSTAQESDQKEEMEEIELEDETKPPVVHQHYQRDDQSREDEKKKGSSSGWSFFSEVLQWLSTKAKGISTQLFGAGSG